MQIKLPAPLFAKLKEEAQLKQTDVRYLLVRILLKHYNIS